MSVWNSERSFPFSSETTSFTRVVMSSLVNCLLGPGAFWSASIVLVIALLTSKKPYLRRVSLSGLELPSRLFGCSWNSTHLPYSLNDLRRFCL